MKINGKSPEQLVRTDIATKATAGATPSTSSDAVKASTPARGSSSGSDSVQISDAGRMLSGQRIGGGEGLTAERAAEIRKRILDGAYNTTEMADQVARRMLASGDV